MELFEIEPAKVTLEANLYKDLDIDSIDAVDLIIKLKEITGRRIAPEAFKQVRTVGDVVNVVHGSGSVVGDALARDPDASDAGIRVPMVIITAGEATTTTSGQVTTTDTTVAGP